MKKSVVLCLALSFMLAAMVVPSLTVAANQRIARLTGWIVDKEGGADHANAASKAAVLAKAEEGIELVFYTDKGDTYLIVDQEEAKANIGEQWDVIGGIDEDDNLRVGSYIKPKKKGAAASEVSGGGSAEGDS